MLIGHFVDFHSRNSSQLRYLTPLFLSLKYMIQQSKELRSQFLSNLAGLKALIKIVS